MIPTNDKGKSDPGHWNIKGILAGAKKVKYDKSNWKPKGRALALSKKLLGK